MLPFLPVIRQDWLEKQRRHLRLWLTGIVSKTDDVAGNVSKALVAERVFVIEQTRGWISKTIQ